MKRKERAYTLAEAIVTLTIAVVVLALIASLIAVISNITKKVQFENLCQGEYKQANDIILDYANAYSVDIYTLKQVNNNQIVMTDGVVDYELNFNSLTGVLTAETKNYTTNAVDSITKTFSKIVNIKFTAQDNIVLCEYIFKNYPTYTNIIKFGVS